MNKTKRYVSIIFMLVLAAMLSVNISTVKASDSPTNAASIWQFTDGFEGALWGRWSCWETPITNKYNRCGVMKGIPDWSIHTGAQGAIISTDGDKNSWSDIGTTVSLSPYQAGRTLNCVAQMYMALNVNQGGALEKLVRYGNDEYSAKTPN